MQKDSRSGRVALAPCCECDSQSEQPRDRTGFANTIGRVPQIELVVRLPQQPRSGKCGLLKKKLFAREIRDPVVDLMKWQLSLF